MQVIVRGLGGSYVLNVNESSSVSELLTQIRVAENNDDVLVYHQGHQMAAEDELDVLDEQAALDVCLALKGGKVHGSLARAGKVRGQTPKVEPQEKKKKKTGRAKRRIQYNRRFVNVVPTFGRRKGPNSNS